MKKHRSLYILSRTPQFWAILVLGIIFLSVPNHAQEKEQTKSFELENGMKIYLYERHTLPLLNLVFAFNLGAKDESEQTSGLVHILEHYILFRGTEFRSGTEIGKDIRRHGAYFNAHTGLDLSLFEMTVPSEYADFALQNQKEILFNLDLKQENLDEEKQVILEEISQLKDDPMKYATSLVYQNLFSNHPYQKPVHGKRGIIEKVTVEQVKKFYNDYFVPSNCALAIVGDFRLEDMEDKVKKTFGDLERSISAQQKFEKVPALEKTVEIEEQMDVNKAYLLIGMIGPDYNHSQQYTTDLLIEIIGRGVNPLLNTPLRDRRLLADSVSIGYSAHTQGGAIIIFITLDPKNIKSAKSETIQFLKNTRKTNFSRQDYYGEAQFYAYDYLESAKNQIKFKVHQAQEEGLLLATSLARFMLLNEDPNRGSYLENINEISSTDLRKAAGEYLSQGKYIIVSISPQKKE